MGTGMRSKPRRGGQDTQTAFMNVESFEYDEEYIEGATKWISFFREYPFVFCEYYLNINLKPFQCILLYEMIHNANFCFIASRGLGKTWLTAVFCVVRCILYPGTKIVAAAGVKDQAYEVISKINEIYRESPMLREEIQYKNESRVSPRIEFKNTSTIEIAASNDNSRHFRANVLIMDEFRAIPKEIADGVLKKFLAVPRNPGYLSKPEYTYLQEDNIQICMTSAWTKDHWCYARYRAFLKQMVLGKSYFCCNLSFHISVKNGLKKKSQILDEMTEEDFDPLKWEMEMEGKFLGENENAFFDGDSLRSCRKLDKAAFPPEVYKSCPKDEKKLNIKKSPGEIRVVFADIALMTSKKHKNDATCIGLMRLTPNNTKSDYIRDVLYLETWPGIHSEELALRIRRLYADYESDYIVMDAGGLGQPIFDILAGNPIVDKSTGVEYEPLACVNNEDLNERCLFPNSAKVIYAVKAYAQDNSDMAIYLQNAINNRKIRFLVDENFATSEKLQNLSGWDEYSSELKGKLMSPYTQTSQAFREMLNLEAQRTDNGKIKLKEASGARKDRYSAIAMANFFATELSRDNFKKAKKIDIDDEDDIIGYFTV